MLDQWLAGTAAGDRDAFDRLYRAAFAMVRRAVVEVVVDGAQAEEVAQDVFLELWCGAARNFDPVAGGAHSWLVTVARRRAVDRVRHAQRARDRELRSGRVADLPVADPADEVLLRTEVERLRLAFSRLGHQQRVLLFSVFLREVSCPRIADEDGLPLGTVKSRVRRAVARLRELMSDLDG